MSRQNSTLSDMILPIVKNSTSENVDTEIVSLLGRLVDSYGRETLDNASIEKILRYLEEHKKLLDDAVYPHLRTQIESMKKGD